MAAAVGIRSGYTSADLRWFARRSGDADQVRRLLALALILDGGSRSEAAKVAGVTPADRARLGASVQRERPWWFGDPQGARASLNPERRATRSACRSSRGRADPGGTWRRALAAC